MRKFALLAAVCFSLTAMADSLSADSITLSAFAGGGMYDGMLDFRAFGQVVLPNDQTNQPYQGTAPTNLDFSWSRSFELPRTPIGDYYEVSEVNTYSTDGGIVINGQVYPNEDNFDLVGLMTPDPNLYLERGYQGHPLAMQMNLYGPIFVYVYGDYEREYDRSNCCQFPNSYVYSVNSSGFEQFLQIERFHADGTPDPFAPEPASFALLGLALLPVGWMIRRRSAMR